MSDKEKELVSRLKIETPDLYRELCLLGINNEHVLLYIARLIFGEYDLYDEYYSYMPQNYSKKSSKDSKLKFLEIDIRFDRKSDYEQRENAKRYIKEYKSQISELCNEYLDTYNSDILKRIDELQKLINHMKDAFYIFHD